MDFEGCFSEGFLQAKEESESIESQLVEIRKFFAKFLSGFNPNFMAGNEFEFSQFDFGVVLVSNKNCENVAIAEYKFGESDFYYSDFREGGSYPLPLNEKSYPVLSRYFGVSAGWYLNNKESAQFSKLLNFKNR